MKIGRLNFEQKKALNEIKKYLKMELIDTNERFVYNIPEYEIKKYSIFVQDAIHEVLKRQPNIRWQKCTKCNNYYPYSKNFFNKDRSGLTTVCKNCKGLNFKQYNELANYIYKEFGNDIYKKYKNKDIIFFYKLYIKTGREKVHKIFRNKDSYLKIIKYLYDMGKITKDNLTKNFLQKECFLNINGIIKISEIYKFLFGEEPIKKHWKYRKYTLSNPTIDVLKNIFNNYLKDKNIEIKDIYNFDYYDIVCKSGIRKYVEKDILQFIMDYYDNKYPAYKFKCRSKNYWKKKNNRNQALKYLIEEDMKIPIEKIPLYLTNTYLHKNYKTMYNILKKYYKNLYEWINEVYPNKFIESDFNISIVRNKFDSVEEQQIDDILRKNFDNVIYNQRNTENTIKINGMEPDWLIFTNNGCWIIEYFGMFVNNNNSKRVLDYKKKTKEKINKYRKLRSYHKLFIFPKDLQFNYNIIKKKLKCIK